MRSLHAGPGGFRNEHQKKLIFLLALSTFSATAQQHYRVIDLGPVGGPPGQPYLITDKGPIAGAAIAGDGTMHSVLWYMSLGLKVEIDQPGLGGQNSLALGFNERGQVVGGAETPNPDPNHEDFCGFKTLGFPSKGAECAPFLWQNNVMTRLPTLVGDKKGNGEASWINNRGEIVGFAENNTRDLTCPASGPQILQFKPVIWDSKGKIQELPILPNPGGLPDPDGYAFMINDNGQAVGASGDCATLQVSGTYLSPRHALLWQNGIVKDLGNLGGEFGNSAISVNNHGQVVGLSDLKDDTTFNGFIWQNDVMKPLKPLAGDVASVALSINDSGQAVGLSFDSDFNSRAVLWQDGAMTDLNKLIVPANPSLLLFHACGINSRGEIIGLYATSTGQVHGYLASPTNGLAANERAAPDTPDETRPMVLSDAARKLAQAEGARYQVWRGPIIP